MSPPLPHPYAGMSDEAGMTLSNQLQAQQELGWTRMKLWETTL